MTIELTAGIVRILKPDGTMAGTGFVVSDERLIATCAHAVETSAAGTGTCEKATRDDSFKESLRSPHNTEGD